MEIQEANAARLVREHLEAAAYAAMELPKLDREFFTLCAGIWFDEIDRLSKDNDNA